MIEGAAVDARAETVVNASAHMRFGSGDIKGILGMKGAEECNECMVGAESKMRVEFLDEAGAEKLPSRLLVEVFMKIRARREAVDVNEDVDPVLKWAREDERDESGPADGVKSALDEAEGG